MEPVSAILGSWLVGKVADAVWQGAGNQVQGWLKKTDIEQAIESAKQAVQNWEKELPPQKHLFFSCEERRAHQFLDRAFTDSGVQEELLRPLKNAGQPDVAFLVNSFQQIAAEMNVKLNLGCLESWLEQFVYAYFEKTAAFRRYQLAKQNYLKQLATLCDDVKLLGVAVEGREEEKQKSLAQIFVMPNIMRKSILSPGGYTIVDASELGLAFSEWEIQRASEKTLLSANSNPHSTDSSKPFAAQQLLQQSPNRMVVLGAPGSGKTTLLSYFVVRLATGKTDELQFSSEVDWLPILVRIREWAEHSDRTLLEHIHTFCDRLSVGALPEGFFEYWLNRGQGVIFLDGLDEVADESKRDRIAEDIELFLQQYNQNPTIITSRPAGYRNYFRSETFPHYELQPFNDRQIEEFINRWYDSRTSDKLEAEQGKASLRRALADSPRIQLLAKNPLLLTIVALIHRYEAYLPKQRYELYERAVKTLLVSWDKGKGWEGGGLSIWNLEYLKHDDLLLLMRQLAYWIHTQGRAGNNDDEGGTLIGKDDLLRQLSRLIKQQKQIELHYAQQEAERLVQFIRSRTGLLNEQGQDCYAFVHKTFQEYLTAEEIHYRHECEDDFEIVLEHIERHLHDPHWREVLLLLVSRQVGKRAAKAIRKVLTHGSEYEQWLHRDLLFAAQCLAENCKNLKTADPELATEILEQLTAIEVEDEERVGEEIRIRTRWIFYSFKDTDFQTQVLTLLEEKANLIEKVRLKSYRTAFSEDLTIQQSLSGIQSDLQDEDLSVVRTAAIRLLISDNSEITSSKAILETLLNIIQNPDKEIVEVGMVLGHLGRESELVLNVLLSAIKNQNSLVRSKAAYTLGKLGNTSADVIQSLLTASRDTEPDVRRTAISALGDLGENSELVLQTLLIALKDENPIVRRSSVNALGDLGDDSNYIIDALLSMLEDSDDGVRGNVVFAIRNLGGDLDKRIVERFLSVFKNNRSPYFCYALANSINDLPEKTGAILYALLADLENLELEKRDMIVKAVGVLNNNSEQVLDALLAALRDESQYVRREVASALGKLGHPSEPMIQALLVAIQDDDPFVRERATHTLTTLSKKSEDGKLAILSWIEQNRDSEFVGNAIDALWAIEQG